MRFSLSLSESRSESVRERERKREKNFVVNFNRRISSQKILKWHFTLCATAVIPRRSTPIHRVLGVSRPATSPRVTPGTVCVVSLVTATACKTVVAFMGCISSFAASPAMAGRGPHRHPAGIDADGRQRFPTGCESMSGPAVCKAVDGMDFTVHRHWTLSAKS